MYVYELIAAYKECRWLYQVVIDYVWILLEKHDSNDYKTKCIGELYIIDIIKLLSMIFFIWVMMINLNEHQNIGLMLWDVQKHTEYDALHFIS